jgi:hypothetical protein
MTDDDLTTLKVAIARIETKLDNLIGDVENLNGFREWAIRLVVGAVILALIGLLWAQGK